MENHPNNVKITLEEQKIEPEQQQLFGLEITSWTDSGTATAHLRTFAMASDGLEYAVKKTGDGQHFAEKMKYPNQIPASEWLCYKVAEMCGIAAPVCKILHDKHNDEYVFGSRIEIGIEEGIDQMAFIGLLKAGSPNFMKQLWAINAFDQFVHNIDRHIGNYLYTKNRNKETTVLAFDFSLAAFVFGWPKATAALPGDCNTTTTWNAIKAVTNGGTPDYKASAQRVCDKLAAITSDHIQSIINEMPEAWIHPTLVKALLLWWDSPERLDKIQQIKTEMTNENI